MTGTDNGDLKYEQDRRSRPPEIDQALGRLLGLLPIPKRISLLAKKTRPYLISEAARILVKLR